MRSFDAETRRLLARRALRILFGLIVLGFAITGIVTFVTSSESAPTGPTAPFGFDDRFHLAEFLQTAQEINGLFVLLFIIVGATAIGAEWTNRNLTASLVFEPRRGVLLGSKLAAAVVVAFLGAVVLELVLLLCVLPSAFLRGTTEGVDASWWLDYLITLVRTGFLAAFGAAFGFSIAAIGRNSAAALGVSFVYFAIVEALLRAWKPQWSEWLIGDNMIVFASGESNAFYGPDHGPTGAGLVLLMYGVAMYVAAFLFFRNRDIV